MADMETLADFVILGEEPKEPYHRIQTLTTWNRSYHRKWTKNGRKEVAISRSQTKLDDDAKVRT